MKLAPMTLLVIMVVGPLVSGCKTAGQSMGPRIYTDQALSLLADYLTGSFSSAAQAEVDPDNYFDIRLHAAEIWADRDDGPWLYVEQAAASALDRPYRQRIYHLRARGEQAVSDVYTMPEPLQYAGWWRTPERFEGTLSPDDLDLRDGCSIYLTYESTRAVFVGSTQGSGCESTLRGAAYATSEVELFADRLETWDRGFDVDGNHVWGATEGGYVFVRTSAE